jgi:carboxyl-terminal processing protease
MKTLALLVLLFCLSISAKASPQLTENQKLESLAKVWGFLKYYHPEVAKGKIDWDAELFTKIKEVEKVQTKEELSQVYGTWLTQLGKVKPCKKCDNAIPDSLKRNLDLSWMTDESLFTPEVTEKLAYIRDNRNQGRNHYVQPRYPFLKIQAYFKNEKPYEELPPLPAEEYRLLGLFRYWNIINYFFPYKYLTDDNWHQVLTDMLPRFQEASTPTEYHLAMKELTVKIDDGHSFFHTPYIGQHFGAYYVPFYTQLVGDKALVSQIYHEGFASSSGISHGDVIIKVNGQPVLQALAPNLKYNAGSNDAYKLHKANYYLFNSPTSDPVTVTVDRDGEEHEISVKRYPFARFGYTPPTTTSEKPWKILADGIGYINMGPLTVKQVKSAMKDVCNTEAIILDLREYPKPTLNAMAAALLADKHVTATFTYPDLSYPGVFRPIIRGRYGKKNNRDHYKGKVVLLVNHGTMSTGEFVTMAYRMAPNATTIGNQTAGADGNIVDIVFPGGFVANMSGLGVYYPDGRETQRVGVDIDIEVKPTIESIRKGEDEILNRALEFIKTGQ